MTLQSLWTRGAGYLVVLIRGAALEKLLNLAGADGIELWEIRRHRPDLVLARISPGHYKKLRGLLRQTNSRARILKRYGLPFRWRRLLRRPGLFCGALLFTAGIAVLTSFVWHIEVVGAKRLPESMIRQRLQGLGLYEGVLRGRLDKDRIQAQLELELPRAAWIGLEIRGIVAVVRIVERLTPPARRQGDLVAARPGLIAKVITYRGSPLVETGQTVRAGQALILGRESILGPDGALVARDVEAGGRVEARVWDEARSDIPLSVWRLQPTGRRATIIRLRLGRHLLSLGRGRPGFACCRQTRATHGLGRGRNSVPFVEVVIDSYQEVKPVLQRRSLRGATALGLTEARRALAAKKLAGVKYLPEAVEVLSENGWVHVRISVESLQDIAKPD